MKLWPLIILIILVACTPSIDTPSAEIPPIDTPPEEPIDIECDPSYLKTANGCCLDLNENAVCDEEEVPESPEVPLETPPEEEPEVKPQKTYTEELIETFYGKTEHYVYNIPDEYYGEISVWVFPPVMRIAAKETLFEIKEGEIHTTEASLFVDDVWLDDIRKGDRPLVNYIWINAADQIRACMIKYGKYYQQKHCVEDNRSILEREQIIHQDLEFVEEIPFALDWYELYRHQEPIKVEEDYQFLDQMTDKRFRVDHISYDNGDGTITKLHVNRITKFPVRVEKLKNKKVFWDIDYYYVEINDQSLNSYHVAFKET